jgi:hypothetical protein
MDWWGLESGQVINSCEHGDEHACCAQCEGYVKWLNDDEALTEELCRMQLFDCLTVRTGVYQAQSFRGHNYLSSE